MHPLDRPVWSSLCSFHLQLSVGDDRARRYQSDINLFASASDDTDSALSALGTLVGPGARVFVLQVPEIIVPPELTAIKRARGVQMIATKLERIEDRRAEMISLTDADASDMLALASLTEPGPFLERTHVMGSFLGIRVSGRLVAMAGERFRFPGFTEVSGVCTHPDFRGRGFARALSAEVARRIESRGDRPFLHAWKTNSAAIALYESLGFELRAEVDVAVLERALPAPAR